MGAPSRVLQPLAAASLGESASVYKFPGQRYTCAYAPPTGASAKASQAIGRHAREKACEGDKVKCIMSGECRSEPEVRSQYAPAVPHAQAPEARKKGDSRRPLYRDVTPRPGPEGSQAVVHVELDRVSGHAETGH